MLEPKPLFSPELIFWLLMIAFTYNYLVKDIIRAIKKRIRKEKESNE